MSTALAASRDELGVSIFRNHAVWFSILMCRPVPFERRTVSLSFTF